MPDIGNLLVRVLLAARGSKRLFSDAGEVDKLVANRMIRPPAFGPSKKLERRVTISVSYDSGWPVYQITPRGRASGHHVVYAHGGAWINEIHPLQWGLCATVAEQGGATVIVPIYPLAPIGTADIVVPRFAEMLEDLISTHGADNVSAMGDSAGGQIVASAALLLRDRGVAPLARTVLISPALDLTFSNPDIAKVEATDPWLAQPGSKRAAEIWRKDLPATDPLVSPLLSDLGQLGPLSIYTGTRDITSPDTRLFAEKARAAGVDVTYVEQPGAIHVYPILPTKIGRAAALEIAGLFK
ncbi:alpha/beta hydrolase [Hoeflea sp. AS60]|uniref:alpha/beta hydrolase n=1 Tax=Hoeflea sp. AS60 TaxID=3135780 RepID=UPI00317074C6